MIFKIRFTTRSEEKAVAAREAIRDLVHKYRKYYNAKYKALVFLADPRIHSYSQPDWVAGEMVRHEAETAALAHKPQPLVEKLGKPGTDILDDIIERHPELIGADAKKIAVDVECPINGYQHTTEIPVELARDSQLFRGRTEIAVEVPDGFLTRYIELRTNNTFTSELGDGVPFVPRFIYTGTRKVLYKSRSRYEYDREAVLTAWADAGYPLKWDV